MDTRRRPVNLRTSLVTLATVASMWRLFDDGSFFLPLAAHAVGAHALATILRRRGFGTGTSAAIFLVVATLALVWGHLGASTSYGFPTGDTVQAAKDQLDRNRVDVEITISSLRAAGRLARTG